MYYRVVSLSTYKTHLRATMRYRYFYITNTKYIKYLVLVCRYIFIFVFIVLAVVQDSQEDQPGYGYMFIVCHKLAPMTSKTSTQGSRYKYK